MRYGMLVRAAKCQVIPLVLVLFLAHIAAATAQLGSTSGVTPPTRLSRKQCGPGKFGVDCSSGMESFFFEHNVYKGFEPEPGAKLEGWSPNYDFYAQRVKETKPTLIVEVGVWKGLSATHLARAMKDQFQGGALIAVDTWLGASEFWNRRFTHGAHDPTRDLFWKHGYPQVYYHFLSNVVNSGLEDYVIPLPTPSRMGFQLISEKGVQPDLIHIDAAHEYEDVVEDIKLWWSILRPGGMLLGDDFIAGWDGVVQAACEFSVSMGYRLHSIRNGAGNKWWIFKGVDKDESIMNDAYLNSCINRAKSFHDNSS